MAKAIMFMGTGSDVGKSLIVAGLARAFLKRGLKVAPFKPQNMSNNAAVTIDGGEIGRAQHLQARASRIAPSVHMNPILLKPESETGAQVIVQGKRRTTLKARDFFRERQSYMPAILESFAILAQDHDLILVEGAGSPAEANLRQGDLANMGFAAAADIPAVLIGDIHRGGVIASLVGTQAVLDEADQKHIKGFLINKFHGDPELFHEGRDLIAKRTDWPCLGVVPHFAGASKLPAEDAVALEEAAASDSKGIKICVLQLPRIANFDDLDPLRLEPGVALSFLKPGMPIPGDATLVILPGSKSTISDLAALRATGWDIDLAAHARRGGAVLGLCGGYQMLGKTIADPDGIEGKPQTVEGLGLLEVATVMTPEKTTTLTSATHAASGEKISAYEIHIGATTGPDTARPFAQTANGPEGAINTSGHVMGTYLHGCFSNDGFRAAFLKSLGATSSSLAYEQVIEETLDALAAHLEQHLDLDAILEFAKPVA
ncbi:cobyric acid synthase [Aestuariivirga litoralis]|uniref:cobyric acid synthase n=1 Tax=Aestuariivirga litoralis TaxID=2650924 RepID=UPI001FEECDF1|nr:cobyric acid synthase [Aestuariivirga litoralis]MBG1231328.1 cobyric acid synthase [Aestuariivirga litoralis]